MNKNSKVTTKAKQLKKCSENLRICKKLLGIPS